MEVQGPWQLITGLPISRSLLMHLGALIVRRLIMWGLSWMEKLVTCGSPLKSY
jgi:hypothetical protein